LPSLTTVHIPDGVDDWLRKRLLAEYNIEIGSGIGSCVAGVGVYPG